MLTNFQQEKINIYDLYIRKTLVLISLIWKLEEKSEFRFFKIYSSHDRDKLSHNVQINDKDRT